MEMVGYPADTLLPGLRQAIGAGTSQHFFCAFVK